MKDFHGYVLDTIIETYESEKGTVDELDLKNFQKIGIDFEVEFRPINTAVNLVGIQEPNGPRYFGMVTVNGKSFILMNRRNQLRFFSEYACLKWMNDLGLPSYKPCIIRRDVEAQIFGEAIKSVTIAQIDGVCDWRKLPKSQ